MKKILLFLLLIVTVSYGATFIDSGDIVTSVNSTAVELQFRNTYGNPASQVVCIVTDSTNTGTIQFQVAPAGTPVAVLSWSAKQAYPCCWRIPITIVNGKYNLYYKASAGSQSFTVTQCSQ